MIKLIAGVKGTGKTKRLIEMVNAAPDQSKGVVVCIDKTPKLRFNIRHEVRLIDVDDYGVSGCGELYGLICGMFAANYDITHFFMDSTFKICGRDPAEFEALFDKLLAFGEKYSIQMIFTVSNEPEWFPERIREYVI